MASFTAAATAYATHGVNMIPFFVFYSMFGLQRVGDMIWSLGDQRGRGFLLGATSGRTTLAGEGLQHQDGHSHVLANVVPSLKSYDPAFAYELAVILQEGIRRMNQEGEDIFYYITLTNEPYAMPPMPEGVKEGILRGLYKYKAAGGEGGRPRVHLLGSGALLREALRAERILAEEFGVAADVWSATSYTELQREALAAARWNLLHPGAEARVPHVRRLFEAEPWPVVAVSDYIKTLPNLIASWVPQGLFALGTDGFGRSDARKELRRYFEVDAEHIALAALCRLAERGEVSRDVAVEAMGRLGVEERAEEAVSH